MNSCYVLHTYPWKETSLIVEVLTKHEGRVALVAKGARRPRSIYRGLLQPFNRITVRYSSKGSLKSLISAEWDASENFPIIGNRLFSGFYVNELMIKLLKKNYPCTNLFEEYERAIISLANHILPVDVILRRFEIYLLFWLGVLPDFQIAFEKLDSEKMFFVTFKDGIKILNITNEFITKDGKLKSRVYSNDLIYQDQFVSADTIKAIASCEINPSEFLLLLSDFKVSKETKKLLRILIGYQLGRLDLNSRKLIMDLNFFSKTRKMEF